jgi:D-glycero-alpha-D-manno-heptose-7-phosphate kinase
VASIQHPASSGSVFHASAPVRLDFAGGWTDVAPFATLERGVVVNAAIELRAEVEFRPGGEGFLLHSDDLGDTLTLDGPGALASNGRLDLLKAALRRAGVGAGELRTRGGAPAGSGLGSSGALDVALVAALDAARGIRRSPTDLAEEAFQLESVEAALPGGKQDQYAAALGGFHRFVFENGKVIIEKLALDPAFQGELARRIVICYTGVSRVSSRTIERVLSAYQRGDSHIVGALRALADVADRMMDALQARDLQRVGRLLGENWTLQQKLDSTIRTPEMAVLESAMEVAGATGGKAAGAGAGGSMFFLVDDPVRAVGAARDAGARVLPTVWATEGVKVW